MAQHKHVEIHAAAQNFINVEIVDDMVVNPVLQPISGEFEFIDQCVGLVFEVSIVETTAVERGVNTPAESIGVCFQAFERILHLHRGREVLTANSACVYQAQHESGRYDQQT
jgi:hypothetical protein